jgi:hypothetical protein
MLTEVASRLRHEYALKDFALLKVGGSVLMPILALQGRRAGLYGFQIKFPTQKSELGVLVDMNKLLIWAAAWAISASGCVAQSASVKPHSDELSKSFAIAATEAILPLSFGELAQYTQEKKPQEQSPQGDTQTSPTVAQSPGSAGTGASLSRPAGNRPGTIEGVGNLTYKGITFYGNIDIGAQYQTHGATYNDDAPQTGLQQVVVKNSNHALIHYSQNGMSQSVLGIRGDMRLGQDVRCFSNSSRASSPWMAFALPTA